MTTCNITEAARLLKVHEETVAEMIRECKIPAAKVGRAWVMLEALVGLSCRGNPVGPVAQPMHDVHAVLGGVA